MDYETERDFTLPLGYSTLPADITERFLEVAERAAIRRNEDDELLRLMAQDAGFYSH